MAGGGGHGGSSGGSSGSGSSGSKGTAASSDSGGTGQRMDGCKRDQYYGQVFRQPVEDQYVGLKLNASAVKRNERTGAQRNRITLGHPNSVRGKYQ